jgi:hypothetical protein
MTNIPAWLYEAIVSNLPKMCAGIQEDDVEFMKAGVEKAAAQILQRIEQEKLEAYRQGQRDGYSPEVKPSQMTAEQRREYNRLAKRRQRLTAKKRSEDGK